LAPLVIHQRYLAVTGEHDVLPLVVLHDLEPGELHDAGLLRADFVLLEADHRRAANVEGTHGELRARLADALSGDDAHGHALFHHRAGREVHAVATAADAQRRLAGHRAADLDFLQAHFLDPPGDGASNQVVLA